MTTQPPDIRRKTLTPFGYVVCVAVPLLIAAVGLTVLHFNYDEEDLVRGQRVPVLTSDWRPGDGGDDALAAGELTLGADRCLRLVTADGAQVDLVWPDDYEATVERAGGRDQVRVYDPDRTVVARSDETVELGGGYGDVGEYAGRPCAPDSGELFFVQSQVRVVGE